MHRSLFLRAAVALFSLTAATALFAAVGAASPSGFVVTYRSEVKAEPAAVFTAITQVGRWWSKQHTFSGTAANLSLEMRAGGCFCERWNQNSVEHGHVLWVERNKAVRIQASLGPLQELAVNGIMTFAIEPASGFSTLSLTYRVRGSADAALDKLAPAVDRMMGEQFKRLVAFAGNEPLEGDPVAAPLADQYFDSSGVRIRYLESGSGEPIILVHGFASRIEDQWIETGVMPALAKRFRVVAFDARGHGKSGKPHEPRQYGREMALDVVRLMDHLGIQRAHIVGYSLGADLVALLATLHPERFITMTLGGSAGRRNWTAKDDQRAESEAAEMDAGVLRSQITSLSAPGQRKSTDEEIRERSAKILAGQDSKALAAVLRSGRELAVSDAQLGAIKVPTLGIAGNDDPRIKDFVPLRAVLPTLMRIVPIPDATQATAVRKEDFVLAIQHFLGYYPLALVK